MVLCEKEKMLLSGNRPDAMVLSMSSHLKNARGIADTLFSETFYDPNFPAVSKMKFSTKHGFWLVRGIWRQYGASRLQLLLPAGEGAT